MSFDEYTANGLSTGANDWPMLNLVFGHERHWSILEGDIESIKPATVIADDDGGFDDAVLFVWAVVIYLDGQIVH